MAWSGILFILLAGWMTLAVGRKLLCCFGRLVPLTMLGVAAIIAGVALFGGRSQHTARFSLDSNGAEHGASLVGEATEADESAVERDVSPAARRMDSAWHIKRGFKTASLPKWVLISLGTVLIISGSLLAGRERIRPLAIKAITALGIAAILFSVVSFFGSLPHHAPQRVRVVPVAMSRDVAASPVKGPSETDESILRLPKRTGEIPVQAELAKNEPNPAQPATTPEPAPRAASSAAIAPTETHPQRLAWVDAPGKLGNTVYSVSIKSGLFASLPECQRALDLEMKRESDHYINEYLGDEGASDLVNIPLDYLKKNVKKAEYGELIKSESVGPMHQIHALLEFDENARADFHHRRHDAMVTDRLWYAGSGAALVLALLGTVYGYLKLDLRSGGAHQGRLQLAATLVALIVAAGALLVRWAVPF